MVGGHRVDIHDCCVVPVRATDCGPEFCLVASSSDSRWVFPTVTVDPQAFSRLAILVEAMADLGLGGQLRIEDPLGQFVTSRGRERRTVVGYLMHVARVEPLSDEATVSKRKWCLAEEARLRIRRKPLRGFVDVALRAIRAEPPHGVIVRGLAR